ncbi:hypothetical protein BGW80DRAFT_502939 [Lactifluus volemus]|nr:hypothetical protein BGW80DRAFT_502939 [Lactifluus volemus]
MPHSCGGGGVLGREGADLYPGLDAGVHLPRHHHRRRSHLIMNHFFTAPTGQHPTTFKQFKCCRSTNATSRRPLAHTGQKRHGYMGRFTACVVSSPNDNQRNHQVGNIPGIGPREVARINTILFQSSFRTLMWCPHPRTQAEKAVNKLWELEFHLDSPFPERPVQCQDKLQ